jgi:hypothetical protein
MLSFLYLQKIKLNFKKSQTNIMYKLEEYMVSILKQMMVFLIFQTKEDLEDQKENWYKICMMVLKQ